MVSASGKPRVKSVGAQIDALFKQREKYYAAQKKADDEKRKLDDMKDTLIDTMHKQGLEGSKGKLATVTVSKTVHAQPVDWEAFHEFVYEERMAHLFFRRISDTAFREILEARDGEAIPGIQSFEKDNLSIRRRTT